MSGFASPAARRKSSDPLPSDEPHHASTRPLLSRAQLDSLYRGYGIRLIRRFAKRLSGVDAADVIHEAFVRLSNSKANERGPVEHPEALVSVIATNVLRDRARAAAREAAYRHEIALEPTSEGVDPHRLIESRETLRAIDRTLAGMNPRRRRIFMLHRFEQMSYAEIGKEVGMSEKGIKKQMAKALFDLRRAVGPL